MENRTPIVYRTRPTLALTPEERQKAIMEDVVESATQDIRGKISEEIFVKYFLPVLIDDLRGLPEIGDDIKLHREKVLGDWIAVACQSRHVEVDVLNEMREVLFAVPAMSAGSHISTRRQDHEIPIAQLMNMVSMISASQPMKGEYELNHGLHKHVNDSNKDKRIPQNLVDRWMEIFKRYPNVKGVSYMEAERLAALSPTKEASNLNTDSDDFLEFD